MVFSKWKSHINIPNFQESKTFNQNKNKMFFLYFLSIFLSHKNKIAAQHMMHSYIRLMSVDIVIIII